MKKNNLLKILVLVVVVLVLLFVLSRCSSNKEENNNVVNQEPVVQEVVKEEEVKKEEVVTPTPEVKEEVTVVEEVTKEDTVDVTTLSYWVNFINPDGSVISRKAYKYGETPVYPTSPECFDGVAYYSFREWDKKLSPVHMTQTYKALYDVTGYVKTNDDNPTSNESLSLNINIIHVELNPLNKVYTFTLKGNFPAAEGEETWGDYMERCGEPIPSDSVIDAEKGLPATMSIGETEYDGYVCFFEDLGFPALLFSNEYDPSNPDTMMMAYLFNTDINNSNLSDFVQYITSSSDSVGDLYYMTPNDFPDQG